VRILNTQCQLAVLAIVDDGNPWAGFSFKLVESEGDSSFVGYRTVGNMYIEKMDETYH